MAHYIIITLLIISGAIGWSLFLYTITQIYIIRKKEIKLISEIKQDLDSFKKSIKDLK